MKPLMKLPTKIEVYIILAAAGILLILLSDRTTKKQSSEAEKEGTETMVNVVQDNYLLECERLLESVLRDIEGIGTVSAVITSEALDNKKIEGVVILCKSGDNDNIRKEITEIVQALFDIEAHKIKVVKMK